MAKDPSDFRDPKVTPNTGTKVADNSGVMKWVAIAVGAVLLLLLLGWLLGLFGDDDQAEAVDGDEVIVAPTQ